MEMLWDVALKQDERDIKVMLAVRAREHRQASREGSVTWCASTRRSARTGANTFENAFSVSEHLWCSFVLRPAAYCSGQSTITIGHIPLAGIRPDQ